MFLSNYNRLRWRNLNTRLNDSYEADKTAVLNKQLEYLRLADERGHYTTTWNIIHSLSGRNIKTNVKLKLRNGDPPENEEHLLEEWKNYFSSLLKNDSGFTPSELPLPASNDLPICTDPPTREETAEAIAAMKTNKAAGLDCAITAEALQGGGDQMIDTIHAFCSEVYTNMSPPKQWVSNDIISLPKKGDLSQMTNYRGITRLMLIAAKFITKSSLTEFDLTWTLCYERTRKVFVQVAAMPSKSIFCKESWKALENTNSH